MPAPAPIQDVSETALWTAHYRAMETERPDALFHDRLAGRLAGERGRQIVEDIGLPATYGWLAAVRTRIIDDLVERAVAGGADAVLNLGAGLDTRPYRLKLPASLQWIEVDQPGLVQLKEDALRDERPVCQLERIRLDLTRAEGRQAFFAGVNARRRRVLVLTEGVIPYLTNEEAGALANDLRACERFQQWIVEYMNAELGQRLNRRTSLDKKLRNAPFRFKPQNWETFFAASGWKASEIRYHVLEGESLGRPVPLPWLFRIVLPFLPRKRMEAFRKMLGYAVLVPAGPSAASP